MARTNNRRQGKITVQSSVLLQLQLIRGQRWSHIIARKGIQTKQGGVGLGKRCQGQWNTVREIQRQGGLSCKAILPNTVSICGTCSKFRRVVVTLWLLLSLAAKARRAERERERERNGGEG